MIFPKWLHTIHHDGSPKYLSSLHPAVGERVRVRLRVGATAPVRRVFIRTSGEGEQGLTQLVAGPRTPPSQWFHVDLVIRDPATHYRFVLEADDSVWWYTAAGCAAFNPLDGQDFKIVAGAAPAWLRSATIYEIFPDRFARGDGPLSGDPALDLQGGDLPGITARLDHLQALGCDTLYLNPIFTSPSSHRYDCSDHEHVDPRLGGDEALVALRQALDARGMRYLLAVELRHVSDQHGWFKAAQADRASPEGSFFRFHGEGAEAWDSWLGVPSLPILDYGSPELRRRIYGDPDALVRRWLRPPFSADGYGTNLPERHAWGDDLDPSALGRSLRRAIKETRPDAYFVTRNFTDVTWQLQGDQLDGFADFGSFTFPLFNWLRGYREEAHGVDDPPGVRLWPTAALEAAWRHGRAAIPWSVALQQHTQLGSQDLPRIRTVLRGDDVLHQIAAVLQFTYPGVPGLYYGDEVGLGDVPGFGQRGPMTWDPAQWHQGLFSLYRDLIALRRDSPALQVGGFQVLLVDRDTLAFQREGVDQRVLVIAHRGQRPRPAGRLGLAHGGVADGTKFVERFSGQTAMVERGALPLPEIIRGATIWIATEAPAPLPVVGEGEGSAEAEAEVRRPARRITPRCPVCGRKDGARRERRLTAMDIAGRDRWVCLWCGATWWSERRRR
ncbi:MAG: alpha-amylase family glycosyl hydrolase [Anaeromyxobacter sp.]